MGYSAYHVTISNKNRKKYGKTQRKLMSMLKHVHLDSDSNKANLYFDSQVCAQNSPYQIFSLIQHDLNYNNVSYIHVQSAIYLYS